MNVTSPEKQLTERPLARVVRIKGRVLYARGAEGRWLVAQEGILLMAGDRLDTRAGLLRVDLEDGSLCANHATVLSLFRAESKHGPALLVRLSRGEVFVEDHGGRVCVETTDGLALPVGTRFNVLRKHSATLVTVQEGVVEVRAKGKRPHTPRRSAESTRTTPTVDLRRFAWIGRAIRVESGQRSRVSRGTRPGAPVKVPVVSLAAWAGTLRGGRRGVVMFSENLAVVEAEHYSAVVGKDDVWTVAKEIPDFAGTGYVTSRHAENFLKPDAASRLSVLTYRIFVPEPGDYYVTLRAFAARGKTPSAYVVLGDDPPVRMGVFKEGQWSWSEAVKVQARRRGVTVLRLLPREIGFPCDRVVLTRTPGLRLRGEGPPVTPVMRR